MLCGVGSAERRRVVYTYVFIHMLIIACAMIRVGIVIRHVMDVLEVIMPIS